jgi:altronate dehydratase
MGAMKPNVIIINPSDNVAVALEDIGLNAAVSLPGGDEIPAVSAIPYSHKVSLADLGKGDAVIKYGEAIGHATAAIRKGEWVHTHNLVIKE